MIIILLAAIAILNLTVYSQSGDEIYFYKKLTGKIDNKYEITMNLMRKDSALSGSYYYHSSGAPVEFTYRSKLTEGEIFIEESASKYGEDKITGIFMGQFTSPNKIEGFWQKPGAEKKLPFYLEENYTNSAELKAYYYNDNYDSSAFLEMFYPLITGLANEDVENKINEIIKSNLYLSADEEDDLVTHEEIKEHFFSRYKTEVKESDLFEDYKPHYSYYNSTNILFNGSNVLSINQINSVYEGGAHPNHFISLASFDLLTGNEIFLADIFIEGYEKALNKAGEKKLREAFGLNNNESLEEAGFWFDDGFTISNNFALYKGGIKFLYNPYEIAPYAMGAPEIFIPFKEIKNIIKVDGVINRLIND